MLILVKCPSVLFFGKTLLIFMKFLWKENKILFSKCKYFLLLFHVLSQYFTHSLPHHSFWEFSDSWQLGEGSSVHFTKQNGSKSPPRSNSLLQEKFHVQWKKTRITDMGAQRTSKLLNIVFQCDENSFVQYLSFQIQI